MADLDAVAHKAGSTAISAVRAPAARGGRQTMRSVGRGRIGSKPHGPGADPRDRLPAYTVEPVGACGRLERAGTDSKKPPMSRSRLARGRGETVRRHRSIAV